MKPFNLKNKWAVVTGASSGIGEEFARQLAAVGVNLILTARRENRLNELAAELKNKHGVSVETIPLDLTDPHAPERLYNEATVDGRIVQILVNNAGAGRYGRFLDYPATDYSAIIRLNIEALTGLARFFTAHMLGHGQKSYMVNVGSLAGYWGIPHIGVYSATKSYVMHFSQSLSHEFSDTNLSVTYVAPGGTKTEFMEHANQPPLSEEMEGGLMKAEEVVQIALKAMWKEKHTVVTGARNKIKSLLLHHAPTELLMKLTGGKRSGTPDSFQ